MALINCEINLILTWSENCVWTSKAADPDANPAVLAIDNATNATFKITDINFVCTGCYFINWKWWKFLGTVKNRIIKWNKHGSEMTN